MKKIVSLLLLAATVLTLAACGGAITETAGTSGAPTAETAAPASTSGEDGKLPYPEISHPFSRETLDALPVANASMTEAELRKLCVDYMQLQATVVWTPDEDMTYPCTYSATADANGNLNLRRGVRYGGLNYSSAARDLASFLDFYDPETGILSVSRFGASSGDVFGNNCGTACFWGWARLSSSITYSGTRTMTFARGCIPLGDYKYDLSLENFDVTTTGSICTANGEQVMYESYARAQAATGLVMYNAGITGHARMVEDKAVVVRNADGSVNGTESYVLCVEQDSVQERYSGEDGQVMNIGNTHKKYTFADLYRAGYLPFEVPELCGKATVRKAAAELKFDGSTVAELAEGVVESNYCISRVDLVITDADGKEVYTNYALGSSNGQDQYTMNVSRVLRVASLTRNLKKGETYTFRFTARLGSGETLEIFSRPMLYQ